ncbi:nucleotidyltransferase family protein [Mesorhizobium sp. M00.F.Ca.ET.216.01.1.1]|uniref:nucleotidyltransferase family protein n=1 Tax=Mesorhizobium sp. M00.F.Ca.ET.216.01.1.1 TaxID=2500528 RepID=UPI000FDB7A04|nr:nucleotidyltransferase family protein [Mesorhizobium sp. M00.F.Ca.ET.216.01.1.1]TGQ32736.1 nucleotidyltransferase family protein [Mesorhizobium sp. M00.F.Ca.ET.216.01.1.1]
MARAVILAGGRGTRLWPYTVSLPKPLMPIVDTPILEIIVRQLARSGFDRLTFAVNHQADILRAYFADGSKWGVEIDYSLETRPLGTMAPLRLIPDLPENFLVMNGDILTDMDYGAFYRRHVEDRCQFMISAAKREQRIDYGVLHVQESGELRGFEEKPSIPYLVSMGIYCLNRSVVATIPEDQPYGFDNLVLRFLAANLPVTVRQHKGYWLDIGRPEDYQKATDDWPNLSKVLNL